MNKPFFSGGPRFSGGPQRDTLAEARAALRLRLDKGTVCPCCDQHAKRYRRKVNHGMVKSLIEIYRHGKFSNLEWVYIPALRLRSSEEGKLAYWGLLEESNAVREDGGHAGWWRVTSRGENFIVNRLRIPKYAIIYNQVCLGLDDTKMVTIKDCVGVKFDLNELMNNI
jgi:hypothetical protein